MQAAADRASGANVLLVTHGEVSARNQLLETSFPFIA